MFECESEKMGSQKTHYQTLGVDNSALQSEIKKAYDSKRESLKSIKDILERYKAEMTFSAAYQVLSDSTKRKQYDEEIFEKETKSSQDKKSGSSRQLPKKLCEILGVSINASEQDIRTAFRKKALEVHPDKNPDDPNATENFQKLNDAFEKLMNSLNENVQETMLTPKTEPTASSSGLDDFLSVFRDALHNTKSGWKPSKTSASSSSDFFKSSSKSGWSPSTKGPGSFFGFGGK